MAQEKRLEDQFQPESAIKQVYVYKYKEKKNRIKEVEKIF